MKIEGERGGRAFGFMLSIARASRMSAFLSATGNAWPACARVNRAARSYNPPYDRATTRPG